MVLREDECSGDVLFDTAKGLLEDTERLQKMRRAAETLAVPDSSERILNIMMELMKQ